MVRAAFYQVYCIFRSNLGVFSISSFVLNKTLGVLFFGLVSWRLLRPSVGSRIDVVCAWLDLRRVRNVLLGLWTASVGGLLGLHMLLLCWGLKWSSLLY